MADRFRRLAGRVTEAVGSPSALLVAFVVIVAWVTSGPLFGFSDTWQLVINTATTIVTFLMVFVIQASQNREAKATQLKLDELIHAIRGARDDIIDIEEGTDAEILEIEDEFRRVAKRAAAAAARRSRNRTESARGDAQAR
jgi:low affinity Fe/Cu permease